MLIPGKKWEPDASKPANLFGHWGPFGFADTSMVLQHTHIPDHLITLLEEHSEEWKVVARGQCCNNCGAGFLFLDVYKPTYVGPFLAYTMDTYSYQADK